MENRSELNEEDANYCMFYAFDFYDKTKTILNYTATNELKYLFSPLVLPPSLVLSFTSRRSKDFSIRSVGVLPSHIILAQHRTPACFFPEHPRRQKNTSYSSVKTEPRILINQWTSLSISEPSMLNISRKINFPCRS